MAEVDDGIVVERGLAKNKALPGTISLSSGLLFLDMLKEGQSWRLTEHYS